MNPLKLFFIFTFSFLFLGCDHIFEYSPYEILVDDDDKDQTNKNISKLNSNKSTSDSSFSIAIISDSHNQFAKLQDGIDKINNLDSIDFVIHLGDIADKGLQKQYEFFSDIVGELNVPLFTCIGNHDYLSNGEEIYEKMFGSPNYSFEYKGVQFIFFDDIFWESNQEPDFDWLEEKMADSELPKIIATHIPPFSDQFTYEAQERYKHLINTYPVIVNLHGHNHSFELGSELDTEVSYIVCGSIEKETINILNINSSNKCYSLTRIPF